MCCIPESLLVIPSVGINVTYANRLGQVYTEFYPRQLVMDLVIVEAIIMVNISLKKEIPLFMLIGFDIFSFDSFVYARNPFFWNKQNIKRKSLQCTLNIIRVYNTCLMFHLIVSLIWYLQQRLATYPVILYHDSFTREMKIKPLFMVSLVTKSVIRTTGTWQHKFSHNKIIYPIPNNIRYRVFIIIFIMRNIYKVRCLWLEHNHYTHQNCSLHHLELQSHQLNFQLTTLRTRGEREREHFIGGEVCSTSEKRIINFKIS